MPRYEVAPGVGLYCEDFGDGQAIVFTAAGIQTRKMWEHQAAELAFRYRTVTYDWRGTGRSDRPRGPYDVEQAVGDLIALVESLEVAPAVLVGSGIGCHVTLLVAHRRPELVRGMVLVSGAPWYTGDLEDEGGFSAEFTEWWTQQTANEGTHIAQAYA
ncbi:MAG: alpha/beta hydrolase, partial [Alphaproteobacteria bacterium]|nr:alpha/beta hydrolase [Alphaproteobacteria bacterium]